MKTLTLIVCLLIGMACLVVSVAQAGSLHEAVVKGDLNEVERLIAEGAPVKAKDEAGNTLLHKAAVRGDTAIARLLITAGAKVKARNRAGQTPLHAASSAGKAAVAELLIANGAKVNVKDRRGQTPLFLADSTGHTDVVELLKSHGAKGGIALKNAGPVLNVPGLEDAQVTSKTQPSFSNFGAKSGTIKMRHWQARGRQWPQAWLLVHQLYLRFTFAEGTPLGQFIKQSFPDGIYAVGEIGKSTNRIGKLEYQRFTRVIQGERIPCVGMQQYARLRVVDPGAGLSSLDDTHILGWYCAAPLTKLTDETVRRFLQGIGVKSFSKQTSKKKQKNQP